MNVENKYKISCIMSNFNTKANYLTDAIESILNQTYSNFELIIIDDNSTNTDSLEVLEKYKYYKNIKIIYNKKNIGLAQSLNKAINYSTGEYIARMDTDDISNNSRFSKQLAFMIENNLDICGTFALNFGEKNNLSFTPFFKPEECKCQLFFSTCLIHPSVMIKKAFLKKYKLSYNPNFVCSQDFEMWTNCSDYGKIGILNEVLVKYRIHNNQVSSSKKELQQNLALKVCIKQLSKILDTYNQDELELHKVLCKLKDLEFKELKKLINWIEKILEDNKSRNIYDINTFEYILYYRLLNIIISSNMCLTEKIKSLLSTNKLFNLRNVYAICYRIIFQVRWWIK